MHPEFIDPYFFREKKLIQNSELGGEKGTTLSVYEVLKVINGIPLFLEDHLERLKNSLVLSGLNYPHLELNELNSRIKLLCQANHKDVGNVEIRITAYTDLICRLFIGFIPHKYPQTIDYENGVKVGLLQAERPLPNAKVKNTDTRIKANKYLAENQLNEVLLYNHEGLITEGSRSNVFFVKGVKVFTAPDALVLKGISRKYALKTLIQLGIPYLEEAVSISELPQMDGGFICGTSPGILPLNSVENHFLDAKNPVLKRIMEAFNNQVKDYIAAKANTLH